MAFKKKSCKVVYNTPLASVFSWAAQLLKSVYLLFVTIAFYNCTFTGNSDLRFTRMLVEYARNPSSIDVLHPRFSWVISSCGRNKSQKAYRIIVASSPDLLKSRTPDLWDSGIIESGETIQHEYLPDNLKSCKHYFWKVFIRDDNGHIHESATEEFGTSFLPGYKWQAMWIGNMPADEPHPPGGFYKSVNEQIYGDTVNHDGCSLLLRHEEGINGEIESARAYISGLGYYEFYINGERVGDHRLAPAKTPYHKYVLYDSYDVTSLIRNGMNAFGIHLGNGWYNPYKKWWNEYRMQWFGSKKAIAEIHIKFKNGAEKIIKTNGDWVWSNGPVRYNCVYDGEIYDANMEQRGWGETGFDDTSWKHVEVYKYYNTRLVSAVMPAIKTHESFVPREIKAAVEGVRVFDMGQNFAGWVRIAMKGAKNTRVRLRFAEDLKSDSTLDISSNEHAKATSEYIMRGTGQEIYEPAFTYFGFRYVEVSAQNHSPDIMSLEGRAVYSGNVESGTFRCSNDIVNKIHKATVWSQKSNMTGYPSDCPQRDERLGWLGDAQVTAEEAMLNFNMPLFYENWLEGIRENQDEVTGDIPIISPRPYIKDTGIEWSSTYLTLLWQYYKFYGDTRILLKNYPAMKRYMIYLDSLSTDMILPMGWIGDWGSLEDGWKEGEPASVPTAYYYWNAKIMSDIARVLKMSDESEYYKRLASNIKNRYNITFLDTVTANYDDGSQMANSFPLYLGLVPEKLRSKVLKNLVNDITVKHNDHVTTGVLGTKYMPEALVMEGRPDIAWKIINQTSYPCWKDMIKKFTTMCEFWTLKQSKNHVMMGSIDAWFYKYLAGIRTDEINPAFVSFIVKPILFDSLDFASARIETIRGTIASEWSIKSGIFTLRIEVPFNTSARVYIPGNSIDGVMESGIPLSKSHDITCLGHYENCNLVNVGSGTYLFTTKINYPNVGTQR